MSTESVTAFVLHVITIVTPKIVIFSFFQEYYTPLIMLL